MFWLDLDYGAVAEAALQCGACFTALLYVEHWCEERHGALTLEAPDNHACEVRSPAC